MSAPRHLLQRVQGELGDLGSSLRRLAAVGSATDDHVGIADGVDLADSVIVDELVELGVEIVEECDDLEGRGLSRKVREADDVAEEHRHIVEDLDHLLPLLQPVDGMPRHDAVQQLRVLLVAEEEEQEEGGEEDRACQHACQRAHVPRLLEAGLEDFGSREERAVGLQDVSCCREVEDEVGRAKLALNLAHVRQQVKVKDRGREAPKSSVAVILTEPDTGKREGACESLLHKDGVVDEQDPPRRAWQRNRSAHRHPSAGDAVGSRVPEERVPEHIRPEGRGRA
eukprot:541173-Hanusia_phi.AAC.2